MIREKAFNILRGCVIASALENSEKKELVEFLRELKDDDLTEEMEADAETCCNEGMLCSECSCHVCRAGQD